MTVHLTSDQILRLGRVPDVDLADEVGCCVETIRRRRREAGIPSLMQRARGEAQADSDADPEVVEFVARLQDRADEGSITGIAVAYTTGGEVGCGWSGGSEEALVLAVDMLSQRLAAHRARGGA